MANWPGCPGRSLGSSYGTDLCRALPVAQGTAIGGELCTRRWGFLVALVLISAYRHVNSWFTFGAPQLTAQRQLTANGREKEGAADRRKDSIFRTGTKWLVRAGRDARRRRSDSRPLEPAGNVLPIDISPDGKQLLALCGKGVEEERELWIALSVQVSHAACWTSQLTPLLGLPTAKPSAYATGTAIYLTSKDQMTPKEAGMFARIPRALNWSQHDQYLRFVLDDVSTSNAVLWGQLSGDDMKTVAMYPLPAALSEGGDWTPCVGQTPTLCGTPRRTWEKHRCGW